MFENKEDPSSENTSGEHEEKVIEKEKVKKWREAMKTAGGKAGYVFQDKDRYCVNTYVCLILLIELCLTVF